MRQERKEFHPKVRLESVLFSLSRLKSDSCLRSHFTMRITTTLCQLCARPLANSPATIARVSPRMINSGITSSTRTRLLTRPLASHQSTLGSWQSRRLITIRAQAPEAPSEDFEPVEEGDDTIELTESAIKVSYQDRMSAAVRYKHRERQDVAVAMRWAISQSGAPQKLKLIASRLIVPPSKLLQLRTKPRIQTWPCASL